MGKKRKHAEAEALEPSKNDESSLERPKRTLLGWKNMVEEKESDSPTPSFRNKEKVLVTCSHWIIFRYQHLMLNVVSLLPHSKKDNKVESKESKGATLNELVELKSCSSCLFFECRKQKDRSLPLDVSKCPNGPSVKFLVNAVHTMEELKLTGNHLKGSRPILTFSSNFDKDPHWKLLKELITQLLNDFTFLHMSCLYLQLQRIREKPNLIMTMSLFSLLLMITYGSEITRCMLASCFGSSRLLGFFIVILGPITHLIPWNYM